MRTHACVYPIGTEETVRIVNVICTQCVIARVARLSGVHSCVCTGFPLTSQFADVIWLCLMSGCVSPVIFTGNTARTRNMLRTNMSTDQQMIEMLLNNL